MAASSLISTRAARCPHQGLQIKRTLCYFLHTGVETLHTLLDASPLSTELLKYMCVYTHTLRKAGVAKVRCQIVNYQSCNCQLSKDLFFFKCKMQMCYTSFFLQNDIIEVRLGSAD